MATSVFQMVFMVPIMIALYTFFRTEVGTVVFLIGILSIIGMLAAAFLQSLLVFKKAKYEQTVRTDFVAGTLIGIWLVSSGYFSFLNEFFPTGLAVLGLTADLSYILMTIGFWKGGEWIEIYERMEGLCLLRQTEIIPANLYCVPVRFASSLGRESDE